MSKIELVKWRGDNGQLAISFPTQPLSSSPTPISRQAHVAATKAALMLLIHWCATVAKTIDQAENQTIQDYREQVADRQKRFHDRALRRYQKLFKAWGMK